MKGRSLREMYGRFTPGESVTVYAYRGLLRARRLARRMVIPLTYRIKEIWNIFAILSKTICTLPLETRVRWAAAVDADAHRKEREMSTRRAWYFRRRTRFQMDWFTLFMAKNILAAACKMSWPRLEPQFRKDPPPAPMLSWAKYNKKGEYIHGAFNLMPAGGTYSDVVVRIWVAGWYRGVAIPATIHRIIKIKNYSMKELTVVPFKIDSIRCSGTVFEQEDLKFSDMAYGQIYIYADLVTAPAKHVAPMESVFSTEAVIDIPRRGEYKMTKAVYRGEKKPKFVLFPGEKMSKNALKLLKKLGEYRYKIKKRYAETKTKMVKATWEKKK